METKEFRAFIVYRIINKINGKLYFGVTRGSLKKRWREHKSKSFSGSTHLSRAFRKYGIDNFEIQEVKRCLSDLDMYSLEIDLIKINKSNIREFGYNNSSGGEASSLGKKLSPEAKIRISNYQKNRKRSKHTQSTRAIMSNLAKGRSMNKAVIASANLRRGKPAHNIKPIILNRDTVYSSLTEASLITGISVTAISNNLNGLSVKTKAGKWEYVTGKELEIKPFVEEK